MSLGNKWNKPYTTAGTKQYAVLEFMHYQYKDNSNIIPNKVYWDNNTIYPVTAVATGTFSAQTTGKPASGEVVYTPSATAPLIGQDRSYVKITAAAANDGAEVTGIAQDFSNVTYFVAVVKSTTASKAGKIKITDSTGTAYATCSFTTSASTDTWSSVAFDLKSGNDTSVVVTGSIDWTDIQDITVTLDAAGDVSVAMTYGINSLNQMIGQVLTYDYITCPSSAIISDNMETTDLICKQLTKRKIATKTAPQLELKHKATSLAQMGVSIGTVAKNSSVYTLEEIYSSTLGKPAITAGTVSVPTSITRLGSVMVGGRALVSAPRAMLVDANSYYFDSATGTVTFDSSYNGSVPTIYAESAKNLDNVDKIGLELGYVGRFYITRNAEDGRKIHNLVYKAQIMSGETSPADDGDEMTTTFAFLPDDDTKFYNTALE
jgi:hypothetical protein